MHAHNFLDILQENPTRCIFVFPPPPRKTDFCFSLLLVVVKERRGAKVRRGRVTWGGGG